MAAAEGLRFPALLGRENGIETSPGAADDGVDLRLHLPPDGPELASLSIHDGIDPDLLFSRQSDLAGKPLPELPVPGRMSPRTVLEPPGTTCRLGQQHQPVQGQAGQTAGESYEEQHQTGQ
jgi:hypothetical protein